MKTKIIVTNKSAMEQKYSEKWADIKLLLDCLVDHDVSRGIVTQVLYLDDPVKMQGNQVLDCKNEKQNKEAIDFIYNTKKPTFLILLGACDIIPFQRLVDPLASSQTILSDLPYACNTPYSRDYNAFTNLERIISRLPDVVESKEKGYHVLVRSLNAILHPTRKPKSHFRIPWAVCTTKRTLAMKSTLCDMYNIGDSSSLHKLSPPEGPKWSLGSYDRSVHYHILHGSPNCNTLYGEGTGSTYPKAVESTHLDGNLGLQTIVLEYSCFGSQLYKPNRDQTLPLANMYFYSNATAMIGCLEQTFSISDANGGGKTLGDCIISEFFNNLNNKSIGEAFLLARKNAGTKATLNKPTNMRMFATFVLYGDASLIPMADDGFDEVKEDSDAIECNNASAQESFTLSPAHPEKALDGDIMKGAVLKYISENFAGAEVIDIICNHFSTENSSEPDERIYTAICHYNEDDCYFSFIEKEGSISFEQQYVMNKGGII